MFFKFYSLKSSIQGNSLWCTPTKQGTSPTCLFWYMDTLSWHKVKNNSSVDFEIFVSLHTLICFLSPQGNFWLIFKHFSTKTILHFLQPLITKTIGKGNFKRLISHNHTSRETAYSLIHTWSYLNKYRSMSLIMHQTKAESVLSSMTDKTHFTQNVTCSLFCGSASHIW